MLAPFDQTEYRNRVLSVWFEKKTYKHRLIQHVHHSFQWPVQRIVRRMTMLFIFTVDNTTLADMR